VARYEAYEHGNYKFIFKYDEVRTDRLHIWVRHRKTPEDAIRIWFEARIKH
jgi:hypothetical protein